MRFSFVCIHQLIIFQSWKDNNRNSSSCSGSWGDHRAERWNRNSWIKGNHGTEEPSSTPPYRLGLVILVVVVNETLEHRERDKAKVCDWFVFLGSYWPHRSAGSTGPHGESTSPIQHPFTQSPIHSSFHKQRLSSTSMFRAQQECRAREEDRDPEEPQWAFEPFSSVHFMDSFLVFDIVFCLKSVGI